MAPRGSTNVRTAESNDQEQQRDAEHEPEDGGDDVHGVQLGRRPAIGARVVAREPVRGQSSSAGRRAARCLRCAWRRLASSRASFADRLGCGRAPRRVDAERRPPAGSGAAPAPARGCGPATGCRTRWRAPPVRAARAAAPVGAARATVDVAIGNRTSTRVSDVLACCPPGPPEPVVRHSSSSRRITHVGVTRSTPRSVARFAGALRVGHAPVGYRSVAYGWADRQPDGVARGRRVKHHGAGMQRGPSGRGAGRGGHRRRPARC